MMAFKLLITATVAVIATTVANSSLAQEERFAPDQHVPWSTVMKSYDALLEEYVDRDDALEDLHELFEEDCSANLGNVAVGAGAQINNIEIVIVGGKQHVICR